VRGQGLERYDVRGGRIRAAWLRDGAGRRTRVEADWFVNAMPVERVVPTLTPDLLERDPSLRRLTRLHPDWMVGIQYFLTKPMHLTRGHVTFIDSPWALTALNQGQFWEDRTIREDYGDGSVVDILSVDVSNWDAPGLLHKKSAKRCTKQEIAQEVLAQIRAHDTARAALPKNAVHSWFLDPGIAWNPRRMRNTNATPLLINTVSSWADRPQATTRIPNLFLSGDYVRTDIDLATMEGANESARVATNAILESAGSRQERAETFRLYDPPEFVALKAVDARLFAAGLPNALDVPLL
jgi:uncharacterized protein with NAD-binding domain and iron-sulfur cluster